MQLCKLAIISIIKIETEITSDSLKFIKGVVKSEIKILAPSCFLPFVPILSNVRLCCFLLSYFGFFLLTDTFFLVSVKCPNYVGICINEISLQLSTTVDYCRYNSTNNCL
jgi:hypothetical protein